MAEIALSVSFFMSVILVILSRGQSHRGEDQLAVQQRGVRPASRFGGVAVGLGLWGALLVLPLAQGQLLLELILCAMPVFAVGLVADTGRRVTPLWRLAAGVSSSLLAVIVFGTTVSRIGFAPYDAIFAFPVPALFLTAFFLTAASHAFTQLEGVHGLCGFASLITTGALGLIAAQTGQEETVQVLSVAMAAVGGLLVVNFPRGLLVLGDAGAYLIGFVTSCIAVKMLQHLPNLSPWAVVLVFFWPLAEMVFAMTRRMGQHKSPFQADRLHFHLLVLRSLEILMKGKKSGAFSTALTTLIMLPMMAGPATLGVLFWDQNGKALALVGLSSILFVLAYRTIFVTAKRRRLGLRGAAPKGLHPVPLHQGKPVRRYALSLHEAASEKCQSRSNPQHP